MKDILSDSMESIRLIDLRVQLSRLPFLLYIFTDRDRTCMYISVSIYIYTVQKCLCKRNMKQNFNETKFYIVEILVNKF